MLKAEYERKGCPPKDKSKEQILQEVRMELASSAPLGASLVPLGVFAAPLGLPPLTPPTPVWRCHQDAVGRWRDQQLAARGSPRHIMGLPC